jgi:hypothetical protein
VRQLLFEGKYKEAEKPAQSGILGSITRQHNPELLDAARKTIEYRFAHGAGPSW